MFVKFNVEKEVKRDIDDVNDGSGVDSEVEKYIFEDGAATGKPGTSSGLEDEVEIVSAIHHVPYRASGVLGDLPDVGSKKIKHRIVKGCTKTGK